MIFLSFYLAVYIINVLDVGMAILIFQESSLSLSYSVTNATGFAVGGQWALGDAAMDTYRTVMVIDFTKFERIVENLEDFFR